MGLAVLKPTVLGAVVLNDIGPALAPGGLGRILSYIGTDHPQPDWPSAVAYVRQLLPTLSITTDQAWLKMAQGTFRQGEDGLLHFDWDVALAKPLRQTAGAVPDLWAYFGALRRLPVLALRGSRSDVLSVETFERMALVKPDLQRVIVANSGHAPILDEPDAAAAIDDFIRRF
jgi:pimeloyl-ACP methyl ester carboxylesterase